jgi:hypothetical protein
MRPQSLCALPGIQQGTLIDCALCASQQCGTEYFLGGGEGGG